MFDAAKTLCDGLISHQVSGDKSADHGALLCPAHEKAHPRTGEAIFPFFYMYSETKEKKYLDAALPLLRWLLMTQKDDGSWERESSEFGYLSTISLTLALSHAQQLARDLIGDEDRVSLEGMVRRGAEYVYRRANRKSLSRLIPGADLLALSSAALHLAHSITGEKKYRDRAKDDALFAIRRVNEEGFLVGGRFPGPSRFPSVDVGFSLETGLAALTVYSCLSGNKRVRDAILKALKTHLDFVTPSGYIDASWGTHVDQWNILGNEEGSGCQVAFLALRNFDARFQRAAGQNLRFLLKNMTKDGLVTAGPHAKDKPDYRPCITPTALRANALCQTLVYSSGVPLGREGKWILPAEEKGWVRFYKSVNVLQVRTSALLCTITGYGAGARRRSASSGGAISHLWHNRFGTVQAASAYIAGVRHSDERSTDGWLAPRIEARIEGKYFSNVFDTNARLSLSDDGILDDKIEVVANGSLKSVHGRDSGMSYTMTYRFDGPMITKEIAFEGPRNARVRVVEPIIFEEGCDVLPIPSGIEIRHPRGASCILTSSDERTRVRKASPEDVVWSSIPVLRALPIVIERCPPNETGDAGVSYALELREWE
jgi:hypothetical protein